MNEKIWDILFEDEALIVCTKPHGVPTQSQKFGTSDMESMLKVYLTQQNRTSRPPYLAVIHRLDQPVSGILVFAKTPKAARHLNIQLQNGGFTKHYRALVDGAPANPKGVLKDYLVRDGRTNTSRICTKETPQAKAASLDYTVIHSGNKTGFFPSCHPGQTELEVHLHTGRHHQIRVQLAHMGCPIAGDTKYNSAAKPGWQELKLCAFLLEFTHPVTGKSLSFRLSEDICATSKKNCRS